MLGEWLIKMGKGKEERKPSATALAVSAGQSSSNYKPSTNKPMVLSYRPLRNQKLDSQKKMRYVSVGAWNSGDEGADNGTGPQA